MNKRVKQIITLIICVAIPFLAGGFGALFTSGGTQSDWYESVKPAITPPGWVFPIAWNFLFLLIGISLFISWSKSKKKADKKKVAYAFGINLILNALWSYLYFGLQKPEFAFVDIIFIWATIVWMIFVSGKIDRKAGWLLVPYLLWVSFASVLNFLSI